MRKNILIAMLTLLVVVSAVSVEAKADTAAASFSFNLVSPNVSKALATITIQNIVVEKDSTTRLTGSGTFDTSTNAVTGGGSVTGFNPAGSVDVRGTWTVTDFVSFSGYGGPSSGIQGGLLMVKASFTITFTFNGATMTFDGIPVQVSCMVNAPSGAPHEGTTIPGIFDEAVSGLTLFHQNS